MNTNINKKQYIKDFNDMMNEQCYLDAISILIQAKDQNKDFSTTELLIKIYEILLDAKLDNSLGTVSAHWMKNLLIEYSDNKDFITNERILETCKKIKKSKLSTSLKNMNIEQLQKYMQDKTNHKLQIKKQMISILGLLPNIAGRKMMTIGENPLAESQAHKMREKTSNSLEAMHDTIEDFANNCLVDGDKIIEWIKANKDNVILTDTLLFKCVVNYINENNL